MTDQPATLKIVLKWELYKRLVTAAEAHHRTPEEEIANLIDEETHYAPLRELAPPVVIPFPYPRPQPWVDPERSRPFWHPPFTCTCGATTGGHVESPGTASADVREVDVKGC